MEIQVKKCLDVCDPTLSFQSAVTGSIYQHTRRSACLAVRHQGRADLHAARPPQRILQLPPKSGIHQVVHSGLVWYFLIYLLLKPVSFKLFLPSGYGMDNFGFEIPFYSQKGMNTVAKRLSAALNAYCKLQLESTER